MNDSNLIQTYANVDSCLRMTKKRTHSALDGSELPQPLAASSSGNATCQLKSLTRIFLSHWPDVEKALNFMYADTKQKILACEEGLCCH